MSRLTFVRAAFLGAVIAAAPALATTFSPLTLAQQAKKADVIVQATIGTPTTVTEGAQTYAVYPLKVSETLAGDAAQLPQTVGSQGGDGPALYVLSGVDAAPVFRAGQEAVLLLYKGRLDSPLVGYNQGAYLISNGQVSVLNAPATGAAGTGQGQNGPALGTAAQSPTAQPATTGTPPTGTAAATPTPSTPTPADPSAPAVTPAASAVTATPAGPATSPVTPAASTPPATGSSAVPAAQAAPASATPPAAAGVLGSIRTPAELKAAIVAARAAK